MAEYIEREAAVKAFAEYLYELPTADVAPVRHGRWVDN